MSASAIIDRLVHHAHLFVIHRSSYRLKDKLKKGGSILAAGLHRDGPYYNNVLNFNAGPLLLQVFRDKAAGRMAIMPEYAPS